MKTITLKLEPTSLKMPVISLRIAAKTHYFVIDTGAENSVFHPFLFEKDFIEKFTTGTSFVMGAGGSEPIRVLNFRFNILEKQINKITLAKSIISLSNHVGQNISGLIGEDILSQFYSVEICYAKGVIKFNI